MRPTADQSARDGRLLWGPCQTAGLNHFFWKYVSLFFFLFFATFLLERFFFCVFGCNSLHNYCLLGSPSIPHVLIIPSPETEWVIAHLLFLVCVCVWVCGGVPTLSRPSTYYFLAFLWLPIWFVSKWCGNDALGTANVVAARSQLKMEMTQP